MNTYKLPSTLLKDALNDWATYYYNPSYFLTIQFPDWIKKENIWNNQENLRKFMALFERYLIGRYWHKKHLPFIVFTEKNESYGWHYHILLSRWNFSCYKFKKAISKATKIMGLPEYAVLLKAITKTKNQVFYYSEKQLHVNQNNNFNSDRIILSHDLFHLPYKNTSFQQYKNLIFLWILSCLKSLQKYQ